MSINISSTRVALSAMLISIPTVSSGQSGLEEIQVVGTPHDQSPTELAQSITVLRADTLRRIQSTNLGETLAGELGVSSSYFGSGASRPIIRGLAGARVRIMEDGIDALDVSTVSSDHAVGIDPLVAEQIEIFRGPVTLLYGSGAVGGVVNTVTNRIPQFPPEDGLEGAVELRANSVADDRTGAIRLDGGADSLAWHFDAVRRDSGDYDIPGHIPGEHSDDIAAGVPDDADVEGFVPNSDFETTNAAFGASWSGDNSFFGASVSDYETDYGVPGHAHAHEEGVHAADDEESVRIVLDQTRADLDAAWFDVGGAFTEIRFRLGVNDYEHVEMEGGEVGTRFRNDAYEGRVELLHSPWGRWEGAFGVQFGERKFSAIGDEAFVPPVDTSSVGIFMLEQREFGAWATSLGARFEKVRHEPSGARASVDDTAGSLSAAGVRRFGDGYSFVVNAAFAERLPSAEELFADGPHLASNAFEIGDPRLNGETSRHVDVGVRKATGRVTWAVTAFRTRFADFIYLADLGLEDAETELPIFAFAQRDATLAGIEAEVFASIAAVGAGEIDVRLYTDFVDAELDSGENLPRIPPRRVGARVQYHDERFLTGLEVVRHDEQNDIAPFEDATDGYTLVSADLSWTFPSTGRTELNLLLRGSNLLDEEARRHTSLVKDLAPLPGRNYSIGFRASF